MNTNYIPFTNSNTIPSTNNYYNTYNNIKLKKHIIIHQIIIEIQIEIYLKDH